MKYSNLPLALAYVVVIALSGCQIDDIPPPQENTTQNDTNSSNNNSSSTNSSTSQTVPTALAIDELLNLELNASSTHHYSFTTSSATTYAFMIRKLPSNIELNATLYSDSNFSTTAGTGMKWNNPITLADVIDNQTLSANTPYYLKLSSNIDVNLSIKISSNTNEVMLDRDILELTQGEALKNVRILSTNQLDSFGLSISSNTFSFATAGNNRTYTIKADGNTAAGDYNLTLTRTYYLNDGTNNTGTQEFTYPIRLHYRYTGRRDDSFDGNFTDPLSSVAYHDNTYYAAGGNFALNSATSGQIKRYDINGTLDSSFSFHQASPGYFSAIAAVEDKLLTSRLYYSLDSKHYYILERINSDGSLDEDFNATTSTGVTAQGVVEHIKPLSDGSILVAGYYKDPQNKWRIFVTKRDSNGSQDSNFSSPNIILSESGTATSGIRALAVQNDGKILIGGDFNETVSGFVQRGILRLEQNGTIDESFDIRSITGNLADANFDIHAIAVQNDAKILIGGNFRTDTLMDGSIERYYKGYMRLNSNGSADTTFIDLQNSVTDTEEYTVNAIAVQSDGKIVLGVQNFNYTDTQGNDFFYRGMIRTLSDGSLDTMFDASYNDATSDSKHYFYTGATIRYIIEHNRTLFLGGELEVDDENGANTLSQNITRFYK